MTNARRTVHLRARPIARIGVGYRHGVLTLPSPRCPVDGRLANALHVSGNRDNLPDVLGAVELAPRL
jgi:hypothetical protein